MVKEKLIQKPDPSQENSSENKRVHIPETLDELYHEEKRGNPVVIAGYGRESTHKGYLSWILDSSRWERAVDLLASLIRQLDALGNAQSGLELKVASTDCMSEVRFGKRKVDLLLNVQSQNSKQQLPIELKTDSGPTDEKQFGHMSDYAQSLSDCPGCLLLCLGSTSVQDYDWGSFRPLTPERLLEIWSQYYQAGPQYFKDWMNALALEVARKRLAHQVYLQNRENHGGYKGYGYRSYEHLMYYVYFQFREHLKNESVPLDWTIYSGGYNAVMNLTSPEQSWRTIKGLKDVRWYFEFNNDRFLLKLKQKSEDIESVRQWAERCQELMELVEVSSHLKPVPKRGGGWKKGWPAVVYWETDFTDFKKLSADVSIILERFGANGVLGNLSQGE